MPAQPLKLLHADEALAWLNEPAHTAAWRRLHADCPWSFPSLSPDYYRIWIHHYGDIWAPLLVLAEDLTGSLLGVFPLAISEGLITGAGAHQAEYQGWLSDEADAVDFLDRSLQLLARAFPSHKVKLRYLVPSIPPRFIEDLCRRNPRAIPTYHPRPLMKLDGATVHKALRKKSTRSKVNRLRRLGQLEFRRLTDPTEIAEKLDEIITLYDFRQGAANDVCPFLDDPRKKGFLLEWAAQAANNVLHISCLTLNDEIIGAHIGVIANDEIQLAVLAYSPHYSAFSPGKLQIYHTAGMLAEAGLGWFDLTPGGDPWKERFASDHDTVLALDVYPSVVTAQGLRVKMQLDTTAHSILDRIGISPASLKALLKRLRRPEPARALSRKDAQPPSRNIHRLDPERFAGCAADEAVHTNSLNDLIRYQANGASPDRQTFLRQALSWLESGDTAYTILIGDRLVCSGWLSLEPGQTDPVEQKSGIPASDDRATIHDLSALNGYHDQLTVLVRKIVCDLKGSGIRAVYLSIDRAEQALPEGMIGTQICR